MRRSRSMLSFMLMTTTFTVISLLLELIRGVLQLLPIVVPLTLRGLLGFVRVSGGLYMLILKRVSPAVERFGISLLENPWRFAATAHLSLTIGWLGFSLLP